MAQDKLSLSSEYDESTVQVVKHKLPFNNDIEFLRVPRLTSDVNSLISTAKTYDADINTYEMKLFLSLFKRAVLEKLAAGRSVELLGLGTLYITASEDESSGTTFSLAFTPSSEARAAVQNLSANVSESVTKVPTVTEISDLKTNSTGDTLTYANAIKVKGTNLKLADYDDDNKAYVYFAACDSEGTIASNDKSTWISVTLDKMNTNKPSELTFYLPDELAAGTYKMIILTYYSSGKTSSTARTGEYGNVLTVAATATASSSS